MSFRRLARIGVTVAPFALLVATAANCEKTDFLPPGVDVDSVGLDPDSVKMGAGTSFSFNVIAYLSDSSTRVVDGAVWSATGGTITNTGNFTAGASAGVFQVIATDSTGLLADTSQVVIVTILALVVSPDSVRLDTSQTQAFSAVHVFSDLSLGSVAGASWNATGGTITSGGSYRSGTVAGTTFRAIASDAAGRADTARIVIQPGTPPPQGVNEPVFTPGLDTNLLGTKDGTFDTYTQTSNITQAGWQFNGTLIAPGRGGSGRAARLNYVPLGVGVEPIQFLAAAWSRRVHVIIRFWFRTSPGADPTSGRFGQSGFKWLILQRDANAGDPNGRITAGVSSLQQGFQYGTPDAGVQFTVNDQSVLAGGFWQHLSKVVGWSTTNAMGVTQRQQPVNDGNWHRYTIQANPLTDAVRVWVDGILIIASDGLPYAMFNQGWDQVGWGQNVVPDLLAGFGFTLDYDDIQIWVRP